MLLGLAARQLWNRVSINSLLWQVRKLPAASLIVLLGLVSIPALADQIRYVYDEAGRLVQVTSPDGSGTAYQYDAIGNILSVKRITPGGVFISEFSPNSGQPGAQVTVYGSGFDEVATNNTVTVNGAPATVVSATKTILSVNVPANATTGKITVTNSNGTATSVSDFVIATASAPNITSFSPAMGPAGTAITISGTNFGAQPVANKVTIGTFATTVSSASTTQLGIAAPSIAASGKIGVATINGKAISTNDFYALPPGVNSADVVFTGRLVVGGSALTVQIGTAGKKAIVLFDGSAKQMLSLLSTAGTFSSSPGATIYTPDGKTFTTGGISNSGTLDFTALPTSGTYTMVLSSSAAGNVALQLKAEDTGTLVVDGPAKAISLSAGQNGRYTFVGKAGQYLGLGYTNVVVNPSLSITYKVLKPDGTLLFSDYWSNSNSNNLPMLPVAGTYTLLVDPSSISTASLSLWVSEDISGQLTPGQTATVTSTRVGQNFRQTFNGTAGQRYWLMLSNGTFSSAANVLVLKPDGTNLTTTSVASSTVKVEIPALPTNGTYTILIDPTTTVIGKVDVQLNLVDPDIIGNIAVDGASVPVALTVRQRALLTFTGTAGQRLGLGYSNVSVSPAGQSITYTIFKPDGTQLFSDFWSNNNSNNLPALPVSGQYTLQVEQTTLATVSELITLSTDMPGTVIPDGAPTTFNTARVGQNARLTFDGTAGQKFWLNLANGTFPNPAIVTILKPDGTSLVSTSVSTSTKADVPALPVTGTYTIFIDPNTANVGKVDVQLNTMVPDLTGSVDVDGAALPISLQVRQRAMITFNGTAGQRLGLGYANVVTNPASQITYYTVFKPDGSQLFSDYWGNSNSNNLPVLPLSGTYTIQIQSASGTYATTNLSLLVSSELTGAIVPDAGPVTMNITRIGQNGRLTFDAAAGQRYWLKLRAGTFAGPATLYIYKPDGSTLTSTAVTTSQDLDTGVLPVSGTYTLWIDPTVTATGKVDVEFVTIPADFTSPIAIDGNAVSLNLAVKQRAVLSFTGTAGQRLGLGYTGVSTVPVSTNVYYYVNKPDGTQLFSDWWSNANSNDVPALPVNGTYTVVVQATNAFASVTTNVWLSADISGTLIQNNPSTTVQISRVGQNARLTFNGTAGQAYTLSFTGGTFPSSATVTVLKPDGTTLSSTSVTSSATLSLSALATTGTYTVFIGPAGATTGQVNVQLQ